MFCDEAIEWLWEKIGVVLHFSPNYMIALGMLRGNMWQHYSWVLHWRTKGTNYFPLPLHPLHKVASFTEGIETFCGRTRLFSTFWQAMCCIFRGRGFLEARWESSTNRYICKHPVSRKWSMNFDSLFQLCEARETPKWCSDGNCTLWYVITNVEILSVYVA